MRLKPLLLLLPIIPTFISTLWAETVMSVPIGVNKITCLANSDTIVGIPFRKEGSRRTVTSGPPGTDIVVGDTVHKVIPLDSLSLTPSALTQHYLHFTSGSRDGRWYDIVDNTASSVTIDLNGDDLIGVTTGDSVIIAEYWTLDTLFPPDGATTGWNEDPQNPGEWIPNGHAIVASLGTRAFQRNTEVYLPNIDGNGINRAASGPFFILNNQWQKQGDDGTDFGNLIFFPDMPLIIRHPNTIPHPTEYRSSGEVIASNFTIQLHSQVSGDRDTNIAIPRPVDLTLNELNLWQSGAFVASIGNRAFERKDELMVFDDNKSGINKGTTVTYYHNGTNWLAVNDENLTNRNTDSIPAGASLIIRKHQTATGQTSFWNNIPTY